VPFVVSGGFMPPSILAVILGCLGLAEQLGRVGRLAIGPGGLLVPGGGALMLAPALAGLVVGSLVVRHLREPTSCMRAATPLPLRAAADGRGWVRTSDLSRVRRALSR
jgi:hypothetical protein